MIKVSSVEEVEKVVELFFKTLKCMPDIDRPKCSTSPIGRMSKSDINDEDKDIIASRFSPTDEDIENYYFFVDNKVMEAISDVAYYVLKERLKERPTNWGILERVTRYSRQSLNSFKKEALLKIFDMLR